MQRVRCGPEDKSQRPRFTGFTISNRNTTHECLSRRRAARNICCSTSGWSNCSSQDMGRAN